MATMEPAITEPRIVTHTRENKDRQIAQSPIRLTDYRLDIEIHGFLCRISATTTFYNSLNRQMEGELEFPLPNNVSVSGFALDINGDLVDASCVTKEKGRVVLEAEERRSVDPGLTEWTKDNLFKTRIYPLPAHGSRTARIVSVCRLIRFYLTLSFVIRTRFPLPNAPD